MRELLLEEEIVSNWKGDISKPLVSICCITYNQELYINDTLMGFLSQETDFPYEILIHDDASQDGTPGIIRTYESKYPNIIKPIYQKENQYSKGFKINFAFNFPRTKGEYVALCEGDDYWLSPQKLQLQVKALQKKPQCDICFHPASLYDANDKAKNRLYCAHSDKEKIFCTDDVILGGGGFMPTASLLLKKDVIQKLPNWFAQQPVGDLIIQVYGALSGGALYLPQVMSVYRLNTVGSWSGGNKILKNRLLHNKKINDYYKLLKKDIPKHAVVINKKVLKNNFIFALVLLKRRKIFTSLKILLLAIRQVLNRN